MAITRQGLRNRYTNSFVKQSLFDKSPAVIDVLKEHGSFIDDFASRFSSEFPENAKNAILNPLKTIIVQHFNYLDRIKKNSSLLDDMRKSLIAFRTNTKTADPSSLQSFFSQLITSLASAQLNALIPGLGLLATFLLPGATAELQVKTGAPNGASDLCSGYGGYLVNCLQGYITDETGTWRPEFSQFLRLIQQGNKVMSDHGSFLQLKECLDVSAVGNITKKAIEMYPTNNTVTCTAPEVNWSGWGISASATNMPEDACQFFSDEFTKTAQQCMNYSNSAKWNGILAGSVIGGIVVLTVCCGIAHHLLQKNKRENVPYQI